MKFLSFSTIFLIFSLTLSAQKKPNIILIMADDMGFSDIGCYGGEIPTPNLDALAKNGLRFTQFYNSARCSPTRAALLTGLNPHEAGMGRLAEEKVGQNDLNKDGYLGYLNNNSLTIAEALKAGGYKNYMAGKWHLGMRDDSKWPLQRGFDKFYGILTGATSYLSPAFPRELTADNQQLPKPDNIDYYATDAFTDFAIHTVNQHNNTSPFFLYLAFNAPHWPLHAKQEDIKKFVGNYKLGWDELRKQRYKKQIKLGVIDKHVKLSDRDADARSWDVLTEDEKIKLDYRMAVYAAQIYRMDYNIGKLVKVLKERGVLNNTLIVFLSDNGGCAEPYTDLGGHTQDKINDAQIMSNVSYGTGWANVSNTPFKKFKSTLYEGGISTPLIIHWPAGLKTKAGSLNNTPGYLTDIMPTFLELAEVTYPNTYKNHIIKPLSGISLTPIIYNNKKKSTSERILCWEQYGHKAIRIGNMKAVFATKNSYDKSGSGAWELYDLAKDRSELNNLADIFPEKLKELTVKWEIWATQSQVLPIP